MSGKKYLCCPLCGGDYIGWMKFVDENDKVYPAHNAGELGEHPIYCLDRDCDWIASDINPIEKSEYKKEEA